MTEKQASQIMEKTVIDGIPYPNILEYMEALNISIDILGTDYTRDQLKNWILINKYPFLMPKYWNPNTMQYEVDKDYKYTFTLLDEMLCVLIAFPVNAAIKFPLFSATVTPVGSCKSN